MTREEPRREIPAAPAVETMSDADIALYVAGRLAEEDDPDDIDFVAHFPRF